mgnify:CR=1 FL=1
MRAYEDRADLLRCLIIGPLGTPFQNAPFLFDVFLSPTKFPQEPPSVFFHSWCGGTRVSPNLYAEGTSLTAQELVNGRLTLIVEQVRSAYRYSTPGTATRARCVA